jgi:hypothetical protein
MIMGMAGTGTVTKGTVIVMGIKRILMRHIGIRGIIMVIRGRMGTDMGMVRTSVIKGAENSPKIMESCSTQSLHA